jgi:hypothetical protein
LIHELFLFLVYIKKGLAPEIAGFDPNQIPTDSTREFINQAPHYLLRPG